MDQLFGTNPTEQEFEKELEIFRTEVEQAKQFFYAQLAINAEAGENGQVLRFMNRTPMLWNTIQYALQKSTFVALGRIFDTDSDVHGLARLLRLAQDNKDMFSRDALAARKPDFPDFAKTAHELADHHFRELRREVAQWRAVFEQQYKSLRDRFYAHRNRTVRVERLFESTRIEQVEQMLAFLGSVYQALWETFINGQEFLLTPEPCSLHEMREHAINGKGGRTVQEQIVGEARDLLTCAARVDS